MSRMQSLYLSSQHCTTPLGLTQLHPAGTVKRESGVLQQRRASAAGPSSGAVHMELDLTDD